MMKMFVTVEIEVEGDSENDIYDAINEVLRSADFVDYNYVDTDRTVTSIK